jgi:polar amino acid transport system permease protein
MEKPGILDVLSFGPKGYGDELLFYAGVSISVAVFAYVLGLVIGIIGAVLKLNGSPLTRRILEGYTTLVRAVPELILILILFYAGTTALNQVSEYLGLGRVAINGFLAGVFVLGFVLGAYMTEVLRAGIQAIPVGQIEAARAYGMSPWLEFRRVILPAMLPNALPGMSNLWLLVTKDTALLSVVGYTELVLQTRQAAGNTKMYFTFYLVAGAIYLIISQLSQWGFNKAEASVRRGQRAHS